MSKYDKELDTRTGEYDEAMKPDPREAAKTEEKDDQPRSDSGPETEK